MSCVTEVYLITDNNEAAALGYINAHLCNDQDTLSAPNRALRPCVLAVVVAGTKGTSRQVYVAGYNYLRVDLFVQSIASAPWEYPECVVLLLDSDSDGQHLYTWDDIAAQKRITEPEA